ncbi:hypothetical protein FRB99_003867, partial [Tulasnella sp. 403]
FSPSGCFFALGLADADYAIWVWDLRSGKLHKTLLGLTGIVWGVDISADDSFVVASPGSGEIRLWRLDDDKGRRILESANVSSGLTVAISPQCDLVAVGFGGGKIGVWDQRKQTLLATLSGGSDAILCTQFSPDGCWLFCCNIRGEVGRWDVGTVRKGKSEASYAVYRLKGANGSTSTLSLSPDGAWFAAISADHGDVHVAQSSDPDSTRSSNIGQVPAQGIWRCVTLGPMSNNASGLAAGNGGGAGKAGSV